MSLKLFLLGPFQAQLNHRELLFRSDKVRALLAYLALETNRPQSREFLATLLWGEQPEQTAATNLRVSLNRLRQTLAELLAERPHFLHIDRQTVQLNLEPGRDWLDTYHLLHDPLPQALSLYRGTFLTGLALADSPVFEEWQTQQTQFFYQHYLACLHTQTQTYLTAGQYAPAEQLARRQLQQEPWREEAHQQLMVALFQQGQRTEALTQYKLCRQLLAAELGVAPSLKTELLYTALAEKNQLPAEFTPAQPTPLYHFPPQFTPLIGRRVEIESLTHQLQQSDCRLVTVLGAGGMGKTRLTIRVAEQLAQTSPFFSEGIYFVPLVAVETAGVFINTLAQTLGVALLNTQAPEQDVWRFLQNKKVLLVLDNFEQLVSQVSVLTQLLQAAPLVKLLISSRTPLNLQAEWRFPLAGLAYPAEAEPHLAQYEAVQLFIQAGKRARPGFAPTAEELTHIAHICHHVEGLPLALEMLAAWVRVYSCLQIAEKITHQLDFLLTPYQDLPPRHQTMRAVFNHSWQLLPPAEQLTLAQLAIFRAGFNLEAALTITNCSVIHLTALLDKSLLKRTTSGRYVLHEWLRQFVYEQWQQSPTLLLAQLTAVQTKHSLYYLHLLQQQNSALIGLAPQHALALLQEEIDNLRQAWLYASTHTFLPLMAAAAPGLMRFMLLKGYLGEGLTLFEQAIQFVQTQNDPAAAACLPILLVGQATLANALGQYEPALLAIQTALHTYPSLLSPALQAELHLQAGRALWFQGELEKAWQQLQQAADIAAKTEIGWLQAEILNAQGGVYWHKGAYLLAQQCYEQELKITRQINHTAGQAQALRGLGVVSRDSGQYQSARYYFDQVLTINRHIGFRQGESQSLNSLGDVCFFLGEYSQAYEQYEQVLYLSQAIGNRRNEAIALNNLGVVWRDVGCYDLAQNCFEQALLINQQIGFRRGEGWGLVCLALLFCRQNKYELAERYSQQGFDIFASVGDVVGQGFALTHWGYALTGRGQFSAAASYHQQALALRQPVTPIYRQLESYHALAFNAWQAQNPAEALAHIEPILTQLQNQQNWAGFYEPLLTAVTCWQILHHFQDGRAALVLKLAHQLLHQLTHKTAHPTIQQGLLTLPTTKFLQTLGSST